MLSILLVDDDPAYLELTRAWLEEDGHQVGALDRSDAALEAIREARPDLVMVDRQMPAPDGLTLMRQVREQEQPTPYVFLMCVTAVSGMDGHREALSAGADDFLAKPLDRALLRLRLAVAERLLYERRQLWALRELLPLCAVCHAVCDERGVWRKLETFLQDRAGAPVTHGYCPPCAARALADGGKAAR